MTCEERLHVSRAHDILITIPTTSDLTASDISEMVVVLTLIANPATTISFTKSLGEVTIVGTVITLLILQDDITVAGWYSIVINVTDKGGKLRSPVLICPEALQFHSQ